MATIRFDETLGLVYMEDGAAESILDNSLKLPQAAQEPAVKAPVAAQPFQLPVLDVQRPYAVFVKGQFAFYSRKQVADRVTAAIRAGVVAAADVLIVDTRNGKASGLTAV